MNRSQPIPVMYFLNELARGGAEEHVLTLMRGLDRNLFRIHLACTPEMAEALRPDLPSDVETIEIRLASLKDHRGALQLFNAIRKRNIGILHSHLFYASLFASPLGWLNRVPVVLETPHVSERWRKGWIKSHYVIDRFASHFVDYFIAVSDANG